MSMPMTIFRCLVAALAFLLFGSAAGLVGYDVWLAARVQRLVARKGTPAGRPKTNGGD
jgi:hypothetical protein